MVSQIESYISIRMSIFSLGKYHLESSSEMRNLRVFIIEVHCYLLPACCSLFVARIDVDARDAASRDDFISLN